MQPAILKKKRNYDVHPTFEHEITSVNEKLTIGGEGGGVGVGKQQLFVGMKKDMSGL